MLGVYHAPIKDDYYEGYLIPEGTAVIGCAYSIHQDERRFPDPQTFEPMRYINHKLSALEYANAKNPEERDHFAYGAGRRICSGLSFAESAMFLLTARMLWGFNVAQAKDAEGKLISIDTEAYAGTSFARDGFSLLRY